MTKMDLIFSTGYDSFVYKKENNLFNKKFVGELQLLGLLERELGLSGLFLSTKERQIEYLNNLTEYLKNKTVFISESFEIDPLGVATELLSWRDQLKLANWDFKKGISERLDLLAELESDKLSFGIADRWSNVFLKLESINTIAIKSIGVIDDLELCHPYLIKLFATLETKGVAVNYRDEHIEFSENTNLSKIKKAILYKEKKVILDPKDLSFQIIKFSDNFLAADFLADQLKNNKELNPIIINRTSTDIDDAFSSFGIPKSGSEIPNANSQIIQLFKLVPSLLFKDINPYNLYSLLQSPLLPFPKKLAYKLSYVLVETNGIENEEWNTAINEYLKELNELDPIPQKRKKQAVKFYVERERKELLDVKEVSDVYKDIQSWCKMNMAFDYHSIFVKHQLAHLMSMCENLLAVCETQESNILSFAELRKLILKIYYSSFVNYAVKEKGSYHVISNPNQLHDDTDTTIWFDFYNQDIKATQYDFLMFSEIEKLKTVPHILLWDKKKQIQNQLSKLYKAILKTNHRICFFIPELVKGEQTVSHPLYSNFSSLIDNLSDFIIDFSFDTKIENKGWVSPEMQSFNSIKLPKKRASLEFKNSSYIKKRDKESYSSIDTLIKYPIDWVLNYQCKIRDTGLNRINDLSTIKGNLSHHIVQVLLEDHKNGIINYNTMNVSMEIDKQLETFTAKYASPLCLPENTFEYKLFSDRLKKSFKTLIEIINENGLNYQAHELDLDARVNSQEFNGKIDLLFLKDKIPVVIDLKWTMNKVKYKSLLEDEESIQLALYTRLLNEERTISGYFLLSYGVLYTTSTELIGDKINQVQVDIPSKTYNNTIIKMINSSRFRINELESGHIELGEDMAVENLDYHEKIEQENLINLDVKDGNKKENPYSNYKLFKGFIN